MERAEKQWFDNNNNGFLLRFARGHGSVPTNVAAAPSVIAHAVFSAAARTGSAIAVCATESKPV